MNVKNITDFRDEEKVSSNICKTDDEAIKSEAFLKGFEACIKRFPNLDKEYFLGIIKKLKENQPISLQEYNDLENLSEQKPFIDLANRFFSKFVNFTGTREEYDNFKITIESMKKYLIKYVFVNVVKNSTFEALNYGGITGKEKANGCSIYIKKDKIFFKNTAGEVNIYDELKHIGEKFYAVKKGNNWLLLDLNGNIINIKVDGVQEGEFDNLNNDFFDKSGLFVVFKNSRKIILNSSLEQILPEGRKFIKVILESGVIIALEEGKGYVVFDINGNQVSPKGEIYDYVDLRYYPMGIVIVKIDNGIMALNSNWQKIIDLNFLIFERGYQIGDIFQSNNLRFFSEIGIFSAGNSLFDKNGSVLSEGENYDDFNLSYFEKYGIVIAFNGKKINLLKRGENGKFYAFKENSSIPKEDNKGLYIDGLFLKKYIVTN